MRAISGKRSFRSVLILKQVWRLAIPRGRHACSDKKADGEGVLHEGEVQGGAGARPRGQPRRESQDREGDGGGQGRK